MKKTEDLYVGIDVHKKSWSVCVRSAELEHHTFHMKSEIETLHRYLQKNFGGWKITCGYEASFAGYWIQKKLQELGYQCLIVNPADIPGTHKELRHKSDQSDCRKIARELSSGHLRGIFIPEDEQIAFRMLFRKRNQTVKDLRKVKSQIRAQLMFLGIQIPEEYDRNNWSLGFKRWLDALAFDQAMNRHSMDCSLRKLNFLHGEFLLVEKQLRSYARANFREEYNRLRSVPGIGPLVAISLLCEIGSFSRFERVEQLNSYIGLVPSIYQSAETNYNRGLTIRAKFLLRSYLIESAWTAARRDPEMMQYYTERVKRMHPNKVVVKIARKLVNRIFYMMKYKRTYKINVHANETEGDRKTARADFGVN